MFVDDHPIEVGLRLPLTGPDKKTNAIALISRLDTGLIEHWKAMPELIRTPASPLSSVAVSFRLRLPAPDFWQGLLQRSWKSPANVKLGKNTFFENRMINIDQVDQHPCFIAFGPLFPADQV